MDRTKHYRYHCNFGHTSDNWWALKEKIEELVLAGHFCHLVQGNCEEDKRPRADKRRTRGRKEEKGTRDERECRDTRPVWVMIKTIVGGFSGGGITSSSQKRLLQAIILVYSIHRRGRSLPPITFTDADFKTFDLNQKRPDGDNHRSGQFYGHKDNNRPRQLFRHLILENVQTDGFVPGCRGAV